jgi:hypothetical protein
MQPSAGYSLVSRGFLITHDAPQSVGLLWTSDHLVAENSTWKYITHTTDKHHAPGGNFLCPSSLFFHVPLSVQTHDRSNQAAVDLRFRPRDHWDRRIKQLLNNILICCLRGKIGGYLPCRLNMCTEKYKICHLTVWMLKWMYMNMKISFHFTQSTACFCY